MKASLLTAAMALCVTGALQAEEVALDSAAIEQLLQGKTIKGLHYGVETRQYFAESGLTLWIKEGDNSPSEGRYKVENNQYCSSWNGLWNEPQFGCYAIHQDKQQGLYYFIGDKFRAPFVALEGFSLSAD